MDESLIGQILHTVGDLYGDVEQIVDVQALQFFRNRFAGDVRLGFEVLVLVDAVLLLQNRKSRQTVSGDQMIALLCAVLVVLLGQLVGLVRGRHVVLLEMRLRLFDVAYGGGALEMIMKRQSDRVLSQNASIRLLLMKMEQECRLVSMPIALYDVHIDQYPILINILNHPVVSFSISFLR